MYLFTVLISFLYFEAGDHFEINGNDRPFHSFSLATDKAGVIDAMFRKL